MLLLAGVVSAADQQLPGTVPLTIERPLDEVMVDGLHRFCLRELSVSRERRTAQRQRDASRAAVDAARGRLRALIGAVDPRVTERATDRQEFQVLATLDRSAIVGRNKQVTVYAARWPVLDGVTAEGPADPGVPPFIGLAPDSGHPPYGSPGLPGFLGVGNAAFRPSGPARNDMVLNAISGDRLQERSGLLQSFDRLRRDIDARGTLKGIDDINAQALGILTSSKLADAFDLSREDPAVVERYGKGDTKNYGDGAPRNPEHFLLARRLVEAGARVVTLNFGRWDFHSQNFSEAKNTQSTDFRPGALGVDRGPAPARAERRRGGGGVGRVRPYAAD